MPSGGREEEQLVQRAGGRPADSAAGRACGAGPCLGAPPSPGREGSVRPHTAVRKGCSASSAHGRAAPEPWSPRAACFPPWWSWAISSRWLPYGTGAGGAGGRRMSKVSAAGSYRLGPLVASRCPASGLEAGRGDGPPPSHPCISLRRPLPVPLLSTSTWSESYCPLPPTLIEDPALFPRGG